SFCCGKAHLALGVVWVVLKTIIFAVTWFDLSSSKLTTIIERTALDVNFNPSYSAPGAQHGRLRCSWFIW
ncbi:hypothetical protein ASPTUDRAFT_119090, partial [Aspergillus tubingensis CBS 134.48]